MTAGPFALFVPAAALFSGTSLGVSLGVSLGRVPLGSRRRATPCGTWANLLLLAVVVGVGACGTEGPRCGPNSAEVDGKCVSLLEPVTCGDGTVLDDGTGECRPVADCGPGTVYDPAQRVCLPEARCGVGTFLDEQTGTCQPDFVCAVDTVYDPGQRLCVSRTACGSGTHFDVEAAECVPDDVCGEGTSYHPVSHLCVPDVVCGPGLVAHEGLCQSEVDVVGSGADVTEPLIDNNDPGFGGVALPIELSPIGESTVFRGIIGRPVDVDSDGVDDQDRDFWSFVGTAGQLLRIRVLDDGLAQPGFRLVGPEDYERTSPLGVVHEPVREVVLPYSGEYALEITTTAALAGDDFLPLGGPTTGYVAIVEELPWPAGIVVSPPALPATVRHNGQLFGLLDNFFNFDVAAGTGILVEAASNQKDTTPVLLFFSRGGAFLGEGEFRPSAQRQTALTATWSNGEDDVIAIVDWVTSNGLGGSFELKTATMDKSEIGAVAPDAAVASPRVVIPGQYGHAFSFTSTPGQVVTSHFAGIVQGLFVLIGPSGIIDSVTTLDRSSYTLYASMPAAYHWLVVNRSASDVRVSVEASSLTPVVTEAFSNTTVLRTISGDALLPRRRVADRAVVLVENLAPALIEARRDYALGMPVLDVFAVAENGRLEERRRAGDDDPATLRALRVEPGLSLVVFDAVSIDPPNPPVRDWSLEVEVGGIPAPSEVEPNDDVLLALPVPVSPAAVRGELTDDDVDVWVLDEEAALQAGEVLDVELENLTTTAAMTLSLQRLDGTVVHEFTRARATRWLLMPDDGVGPFVAMVSSGSAEPIEYILNVRRRALASEVEPNDNAGSAQSISVATGTEQTIYGRTRNEGDHYALAPVAPLPFDAVLRVRADNLLSSDDLILRIVDGGGSVLGNTDHEDGVLLARTTGTTPIFAIVTGTLSTKETLYRLVVDVLDRAEIEPNDTVVEGTVVEFAGSAQLWGQSARGVADHYRILPDRPLLATESYSIRWLNQLERGDIHVSVLDENAAEVLLHEHYAGEIIHAPVGSAAPFFVKVVPDGAGASVRPELYLLDIQRIPATGDREPNDDIATAQELTLPAQVRGQSRTDDVDVYRFEVNGDEATIHVVTTALHRMIDLDVSVRDASGQEVAAGIDVDLDLQAAASAGVWTVHVNSTASSALEYGVYELDVRLDP